MREVSFDTSCWIMRQHHSMRWVEKIACNSNETLSTLNTTSQARADQQP